MNLDADPAVSEHLSQHANMTSFASSNNEKPISGTNSCLRHYKDLINEKPENFTKQEQLVIVELIEEYTRRGNFELIFPRAANYESYKKYFRLLRSPNVILWRWLQIEDPEKRMKIIKDFYCRDNSA